MTLCLAVCKGDANGCRFIRWSDGSLQLQIGDEVLDVAEHDVRNDHSFLFIRHSQIIQARWPRKRLSACALRVSVFRAGLQLGIVLSPALQCNFSAAVCTGTHRMRE